MCDSVAHAQQGLKAGSAALMTRTSLHPGHLLEGASHLEEGLGPQWLSLPGEADNPLVAQATRLRASAVPVSCKKNKKIKTWVPGKLLLPGLRWKPETLGKAAPSFHLVFLSGLLLEETTGAWREGLPTPV